MDVLEVWWMFLIELGKHAAFTSPSHYLSSFMTLLAIFSLEHARRTRYSKLPHVNTSSHPKNTPSNSQTIPEAKTLVLIGGGHSHVFVLKHFGMNPIPGLRIVLISKEIDTPYSGMLPGYLAGHYSREQCHIDLMRLSRFAKAELVHDKVIGIDVEGKHVMMSSGRPPVSYDILSIDIGSTPFIVENDLRVVVPVKPIDRLAKRWECVLETLIGVTERTRVVVVGSGAGGVELLLSMQFRVRKERERMGKDPEVVQFTLIGKSHRVMPSHNEKVSSIFTQILRDRNVTVLLNSKVIRVDEEMKVLYTFNQTSVSFDVCFWCTQAGSQKWLKETSLQLNDTGFIKVNRNLQSINSPDIFATGDCCDMVHSPRAKAGVFAVRQGPPLTRNIRAMLLGEQLVPYYPQTDFLGIISTGDPNLAVASRGHIAIKGEWLWSLKDWIDRTWMAQYSSDLPLMKSTIPTAISTTFASFNKKSLIEEASMRCGGCGCKVDSSILTQVLQGLEQQVDQSLVITGITEGDDAAVVKCPSEDFCSVHTVDFFRSFVSDPFVFGQIAANHALSDMDAMLADPQTALAIVVLPYGDDSIMKSRLEQMMMGAVKALNASGCVLVGGHTSEGVELSLGFAINGILRKDRVSPKIDVGYDLILTKPIGTGVLYAADMKMQSKAVWTQSAIESSLQSNRKASLVLQTVEGAVCTDVTGFGLVGHLLQLLKSSDKVLSANLSVTSIPVLEGVRECFEMGIRSSLHEKNRRFYGRKCIGKADDILFDPQTAGGLLIAVHPSQTPTCLSQLIKAGYTHTSLIGSTEPSRTREILLTH